jgi:hypothetical protein
MHLSRASGVLLISLLRELQPKGPTDLVGASAKTDSLRRKVFGIKLPLE